MKTLLLIGFGSFFILTNLSLQTFAQIEERKKPELKDFGSSLNRKPEENLNRKNSTKKDSVDDEIIRVETNLVVTDVSVFDNKGNSIHGLKKEDFIITEDDQPQEVHTFALGDDPKIPRSIVLVIDYSDSLLAYIERSINAAKLLVNKLRPNDLMAIVTDDVKLTVQFTSDKKILTKELDKLKGNALRRKIFGKSHQYSSLYATLNEMFDEEDIRPIILFQTDGDQLYYLKNGIDYLTSHVMSQRKKNPIYTEFVNFSFDDLMDKIEKTKATIYTVVPGYRRIGLPEEERKERIKLDLNNYRKAYDKLYGNFLSSPNPFSSSRSSSINIFEERNQIRDELIKKYYPNGLPDLQDGLFLLSKSSGGWIDFLEKPEEADEIYTKILSKINTRYIIGYSSSNETKDGKRRIVKVEVKNHPEYTVWGRKSYFAPMPD